MTDAVYAQLIVPRILPIQESLLTSSYSMLGGLMWGYPSGLAGWKYQGNNIPQPMTDMVSSLSHMFDNSEICVYVYTVCHGFILWLNFLGFHDVQFSSVFYVAPF